VPDSWTDTEERAINFNPASRFVGRAMAVGILGLLASSGQVTPQEPAPIERVGQLLAEAKASFARVREVLGLDPVQNELFGEMADAASGGQ
jgi:hypothetical protein